MARAASRLGAVTQATLCAALAVRVHTTATARATNAAAAALSIQTFERDVRRLSPKPVPPVPTPSRHPLLQWALVLGPVAGYAPQALEIRRARSSEGFSPFVCFVLLTANILRVFFWLGKRFDTTLLLQSAFMIAVQLALLHECVAFAPLSARRKAKPLTVTRFWTGFWQWPDFESYAIFLAGFCCVVGLVCHVGMRFPFFVEALGYVALAVEACLAVPQVIRNFRRKNAHGLSRALVLGWLVGDSYKLFYAAASAAPVQFVLCATAQILTDATVLLQMACIYRGARPSASVELPPAASSAGVSPESAV